MEANMKVIDELLEKECYIIDFLPDTVLEKSNGQFFDVEYFLLNGEKNGIIKNRFVCVILKLMCYYHTSILWNEWIDRPKPGQIENIVSEIMTNHSGSLNCLFPDENVLLVFDWDCLNLTVYNPPESMQQVIEKIACSEGLFWRLGQ